MTFFCFSRLSKIVPIVLGSGVLLSAAGCNDDFGYQNHEGKQIAFNITAPNTWHYGMEVDENGPTTRCQSVQELTGDGDTKLYLHAVVADNPVEETIIESRGTPIGDSDKFKDTYSRFSLSGICYTGEYPSDETRNEWTTEYAHNLYYSTTTGEPAEGGSPLFWPHNGKVRFFAFAPVVEDFDKLTTGGFLEMGDPGQKGSPRLTYTVPKDVEKQIDLMTVCKDFSLSTTQTQVDLEFGHALTAVRIKCGKDMLAGTISKVEIAGVYGSGTQVIGSGMWETTGATATYTISKEISLPTDGDSGDIIHAVEGTPIAGADTDTDNLTFMLMPQTLPEGAAMTIEFVDKATGTPRTLTASIAGHIWQAGKIITYSISPSSIHINPTCEITKEGADIKDGVIMPYSGVWYDMDFKAKAEITQAGVDTKTLDIPAEKVKFEYRFKGSDSWEQCTGDKDDKGVLKIASQPAYSKMIENFITNEAGSKDSPFSLSDEYGESANCYLVDRAGYYSLPLVYGNGYISLPADNPDGFKYFPNHDDNQIPADGRITGVGDAVLLWQDAPDLIDPGSVRVKGDKLVFRIRRHTLTQGNAVLAVRDNAPSGKKILWSWHIWVTPYKTEFYEDLYHSKTYKNKDGAGETAPLREYDFAKYNLGWCDPHGYNDSREFSLRAVVDMSAYGGGNKTPLEIGTFTQEEFKGSNAGDNTYYQWGRKDPMLGGIYNDKTPTYKYKKKGTSDDEYEFTMENKQVFNQYKRDGYDYSFCKNPGDLIDASGEASKGVTIGYSIRHPYMFITNSKTTDTDKDASFNYRNHWHIPYVDKQVGYFNKSSHIMFNAWDAAATGAGASNPVAPTDWFNYVFTSDGVIKEKVEEDYLRTYAADIKKTVYDPCPPKFKMPPIDAFRGIAHALASNNENCALGTLSISETACEITNAGGTISFPMTGLRNYALRSNEWKTVVPSVPDPDFNYKEFYKISMPAFKMLTFVSSATIVAKGDNNAYQLLIFAIDKKDRKMLYDSDNVKISCFTTSSNSYGLPVRPIKSR